MNELLILIMILASTVVGAKIFHKHIGGAWGLLLGSVAGFLFVPVLIAIWGLFITFTIEGVPRLPACANGCCRSSDYELRRFRRDFYWVCKCGDRYTRRGRLFLQVPEEGEPVLCRTWRPFRGWFPKEERSSG